MNFDTNIKQMLGRYPNRMSDVDKLREILQQTALLGLSRHQFFKHAAFYGDTALRILYGLARYSEDLDFSLLQPDSHFNFKPFLEGMHQELEGFGFKLDVTIREKKF
jgi:predicted nucleotidyltransferase component of viral defense system